MRPGSAALWSGIFAGPIAFAVTFELKYALVDYVCRNRAGWVYWIAAAGGLVLCAYGAFMAWSGGQAPPPVEMRARFMSLAGIGLAITFAIFIIALTVPDLFLRPCE